MSALPARERGDGSDSVVSLRLDDDDLARAVVINARSRDEARRCDALCAQWLGAGRRIWREPQPVVALHRRMLARVKARFARQFLNQALAEWRPNGGGH